MIITKIIGGTGNQLFQYALGRSLAIINNTNLKIDIRSFNNYKLRKYSLNNYNIVESIASESEIKNITRFRKIKRLINKISFGKYKVGLIMEEQFHYDPKVMESKDNSYLEGYWQTYKYFKNIEDTIRKEFTVKAPQEGKNRELSNKIKGNNSVSLHIRRTDYITDHKTNITHGVCNINYYVNAIEYIAKRMGDIHIYVFSDDNQWAVENIKVRFPTTFINHNGPDQDYEDLRLMSQCKHNIIANSSFSWWGAWLNINPNKIVVAPNKWFNQREGDTKDLLMDDWIAM